MENNKQFYYPQLDGLRFFAFLLVFIHNAPHVEAITIWKVIHQYGWIGVDLFFCLSAYLISKILVMEYKKTGNINIRNFYIRRILRIWPIYFFYIAMATLYITKNYTENLAVTNHLFTLFSFTYNFAYPYLYGGTYFLFVHLWTISFEEQFYAVIPWVVKKIQENKTVLKNSMVAIFLFGTMIRALFILFQVKHPVMYMSPVAHFEAITFGTAIGLGFFKELKNKTLIFFLFCLGIILNLLVFSLPNTFEIGWKLMLTYPLAGFGASLILYSITQPEQNLLFDIFKFKPFIYLGKISFGLYIYHIAAIAIADTLFRFFSIPWSLLSFPIITSLLGLLITISFSTISFIILEKPLLNLKRKFNVLNYS